MSNWIENEEINTPETEIIEENIYVDEDLIKNKDLVRMDLNIVQYPLFSKNTKRKVNQIVKYYFNKNHDTYINVAPMAGDYIPGELEEKIFIALMKIMKAKGMPRKFIVTAKELKDELKINSNTYISKIKESLSRLASANYKFKNTMYSSKEKTVLTEEIETTILSLRTLKLVKKENKKLKEEIGDNRVKEVYEVSISSPFYDNIMTKGYLVYNSDILLSIDTSTARTTYMLIEKLRFNELYLKIDTLFLIRRIPLKFNPRNPSNTIKILEKNLNELKEKKLIENFNFIKESTWEKSEIEIYFYEEVNSDKQERFYSDLNDFRKISTSLAVLDMEHAIVANESVLEDKIICIEITKEIIEEVFNMLPGNAKKLKSMKKTIKDSIDNYGLDKVKAAVMYMSKQKKITSPRAFFLKSLDNNWAEDIVVPESKNEKNKELIINELEIIENQKDYSQEIEYYKLLTEQEKKELEEKVYSEYMKECGQETKVQKIAFNAAKNNLIYKYIFRNKLSNYSIIENEISIEEELGDDILTDINAFNNYINENINIYKIVLNLSEDRILEIKREILTELSSKFVLKQINIDDITQAINKVITDKMK